MSDSNLLNSATNANLPNTASLNKSLNNSVVDTNGDFKSQLDNIYQVQSVNWYQTKPYGFKINLKNGKSFVFFLPISPQNISINTQFATNVIPTLYGTIEEHSEVRYYDISISGTTGFAPKYVDPADAHNMSISEQSTRQHGRSSFAVTDGIIKNSSTQGFFSKTIGVINQIANKVSDIKATLTPNALTTKTGIGVDQTGYAAFHNLYRFLLQHKKDITTGSNALAEGVPPLVFFNYKDNNQYKAVIRAFTLTRSADNPMLYNYSIQIRGYDMTTVGSTIVDDIDQRLAALGLNGVDSSSMLGDMKNLSNSAKSVFGAAQAGINILGR